METRRFPTAASSCGHKIGFWTVNGLPPVSIVCVAANPVHQGSFSTFDVVAPRSTTFWPEEDGRWGVGVEFEATFFGEIWITANFFEENEMPELGSLEQLRLEIQSLQRFNLNLGGEIDRLQAENGKLRAKLRKIEDVANEEVDEMPGRIPMERE